MLFNSAQFMIFLPLVCLAYFALPHRWRWLLLLLASYYFYASWRPEYLILIVASTGVDYCAALLMDSTKEKRLRLLCLFGSLACNLGLLFTFKYFNFFNTSMRVVFDHLGMAYPVSNASFILPVGISFYTFQTLSYTIEVYRGTHKAERHLGIFALYVSFFPQLVAGPIERSSRFLPQLLKENCFDSERAAQGLRLTLWGLFKKVVIADRLAQLVTSAYDAPGEMSGPALVLATVFFAFQIYCDFSGYSDIAIGAARIMGYDLMTNFDRPYSARSIGDFWKRWHISLSTWFQDYVYIPLGGSRVSVPRLYLNLLVVFTVSGLWHGANWTFIAWGALHAVYYMASRFTRGLRASVARLSGLDRSPRLHHVLQVLTTFVLVCLGWVFFRASSLSDAWLVLKGIPFGWSRLWVLGEGRLLLEELGTSAQPLGIASLLIAVLLFLEVFQKKGAAPHLLAHSPPLLRWAAYLALTLLVLNMGEYHEIPFIYFQF